MNAISNTPLRYRSRILPWGIHPEGCTGPIKGAVPGSMCAQTWLLAMTQVKVIGLRIFRWLKLSPLFLRSGVVTNIYKDTGFALPPSAVWRHAGNATDRRSPRTGLPRRWWCRFHTDDRRRWPAVPVGA